MNKQIKELANDLAKICPDLVENCCGQINCVTHLTLSLHKLGYRKQIEGEWKVNGDYLKTLNCSICHYTATSIYEKSDYCPNCGAKLKGGEWR